MRFRSLLLIALFLAANLFAATPTPVVGVVLEMGSDLPLDGVQITYRSGKKLGKTSSDGRFEFTVDSKNASLVFQKEGYDSVYVDLQDFADLLDMVVTLSTDLRDLGSSTIVGGGEPEKWEPQRKVSVDKLEDAAGMRFDLTEHLGQMPGISGQKDFSSALYYDGSRAGDVVPDRRILAVRSTTTAPARATWPTTWGGSASRTCATSMSGSPATFRW